MRAESKGNRKQTTEKEENGTKTTPKSARKSKTKAELVSKVIQTFEKKLNSDQLKPTVGDFIRLLQLEKELEEQQPREIEVTWVERDGKKNASDT
jgi:hypothetical protein